MSCTKSNAFESLCCVYADAPPPIALGEPGAFPAEACVPILGDEGGDAAIPIPGAIPDAPIHHGFDEFFGTACCPTTDWLYAFIDGDKIPVPPTEVVDRDQHPKNVYTRDFRPGLIAPGFDIAEIDEQFLEKLRCQRRFLGRLEDHPVVGRDGRRDLVCDLVEWMVEGRDRADDAEQRLALRVDPTRLAVRCEIAREDLAVVAQQELTGQPSIQVTQLVLVRLALSKGALH